MNTMKIELNQLRGSLRSKVEAAIQDLQAKGCKVVALFFFNDTDREYSWRSKGKFIAIRYVAPHHGFQQYDDKEIYFK